MAGQATAIPLCRRHASEARRPEAGSRAGGVSRAERGNDGSPKGARRRRRLDAKHDSATGQVLGRGRPCSRRDAAWIFCGGQAAFAASVLPRRRSRGAKRSAAGMCRRHFPWSASASAQRRRRVVIGTRAQQKKRCAAPQGSAGVEASTADKANVLFKRNVRFVVHDDLRLLGRNCP